MNWELLLVLMMLSNTVQSSANVSSTSYIAPNIRNKFIMLATVTLPAPYIIMYKHGWII